MSPQSPYPLNSTLRRRSPMRRGQTRMRARRPNSAASRRPGMSTRHLSLIRTLPCCITGRPGPSDPHHIKSGPARLERATGRKATDRWAVPLSREIHDQIEGLGSRNEDAWFRERGIDVVALAEALWEATGDLHEMERVLFKHTRGIGLR